LLDVQDSRALSLVDDAPGDRRADTALLTQLGLPSPDDGELWRDRGLCAQTDPDSFFPEKGESTREAKKICLGCEVRSECLAYALLHDERFGIWGGLSEPQRRKLKKSVAENVA
jgi:WhiB family redox-sensing transcriptional regulator